MARRDYGTGSVYQRAQDGRWVGSVAAGYTASGARRRITVVARTEAEAKRKLNKKRLEVEEGRKTIVTGRTTVKTWAAEWLPIQERNLRPNAYSATRTAVQRWIVPTLGPRRLTDLRPSDVRAIADAQRAAGRSSSNAAQAQRVFRKMLKDATQEGHRVPAEVVATKLARMAVSDREAIPLDDLRALVPVIDQTGQPLRWATALVTGWRSGECLGLTWEHVDFTRGALVLSWQLQALPYNRAFRPASGFRIPDGYEVRHLVDAWHLVRPKSKAGFRMAPLPPAMMDAFAEWQEVAPANPWGLVWPTVTGRPANPKRDREEWQAIQATAGVTHPSGRFYHVHECRHTAATLLQDAGTDEHTIKTLMGHSSIAVSRGYMHVGLDGSRRAIAAVTAGLGQESERPC
jgi:integrase